MMISPKHIKTSNGNKHKNSRGTEKNPLYTANMYTEDERITIGIPRTSKIYQYLDVHNTNIKVPKWKRLDAILALAERNKEEFTIKIYDDFVERMNVFYPDKIDELNKLRPLIIKHILKGEDLDESYYKMLREL